MHTTNRKILRTAFFVLLALFCMFGVVAAIFYIYSRQLADQVATTLNNNQNLTAPNPIETKTISISTITYNQQQTVQTRELYQNASAVQANSIVYAMLQVPSFIAALSPAICQKWKNNKLTVIGNVGINGYYQIERICNLRGTPIFNLLISSHNIVSGTLQRPIVYTSDTIANFAQNFDNYLVDLKINNMPASMCQAKVLVLPGAKDLNVDPTASIMLSNITCGQMSLFSPYQSQQTITLTCTKHRFDSDFARKYLGYFNKCEAFAFPEIIQLNADTYQLLQ